MYRWQPVLLYYNMALFKITKNFLQHAQYSVKACVITVIFFTIGYNQVS